MKRTGDLVGRFHTERAEEFLPRIPDGLVNLVFTSPPYSDQRDYGRSAVSVAPDGYVEWFLPIARQIYRVLSDQGSFILNVSDKTVHGQQHLCAFELLISLVRDVGFRFVRDYIWFNPATPPNIYGTGKYGKTKKSHEYCFWLAKSDHWTFNMDAIRKPYSRDMEKFLLGRVVGNRAEHTRPSTHSFDCSSAWKNHGGSDPGSVIVLGNNASNDWFTKECRARGIRHPARFPEGLAQFFIAAGSNPGDTVLDPFSGSGTTAVVAQRLERKWIAVDSNPDFNEMAGIRVARETEG